jgi:hypothetical protein
MRWVTLGNHVAKQLWDDWLASLPGSWVSQSSASCVAVSSIFAAPFSNMCSTQADNNFRKLRLRCSCQFPWCALALSCWTCIALAPDDLPVLLSDQHSYNSYLLAQRPFSWTLLRNVKVVWRIMHIRYKSLWRWYISTNIMFLDIIHHLVFI